MQARQTLLPPREDLLQDRHQGTVSERSDSSVRLQREAVPRRDQLQRGVRLHQRHAGRQQMRDGRQRRLREHAGYGHDQPNLLQAVHAGPVLRGRMAGRSKNAAKLESLARRRAAQTEGQMRMSTRLQENRRDLEGGCGRVGEQQSDIIERLPAAGGEPGEVSQRQC